MSGASDTPSVPHDVDMFELLTLWAKGPNQTFLLTRTEVEWLLRQWAEDKK